MADAQLNIIIQAENRAKSIIEDLRRQFQTLSDGLQSHSKKVGQHFKEQSDALKNSSDAAGAAVGQFQRLNETLAKTTEFGETLISTLKGMTLGFLGLEVTEFAKDLAFTAGQTQLMGTTLELVAKNAGITATEIHDLDARVQALGITAKDSRQSIANMLQVGLNANQAPQLARLAQDLAVFAQEDSSTTFRRLVDNIAQVDTLGLRYMGILVDRQRADENYARTLGVSVGQLDLFGQRQAFANEVIRQGTTRAGAYEAAMTNVQKQVLSFQRVAETTKEAWGDILLPALGELVTQFTVFTIRLEGMAYSFDKSGEKAKSFADVVGTVAKELFDGIAYLIQHKDALYGLVEAYVAFRVLNIATYVARLVESYKSITGVLKGATAAQLSLNAAQKAGMAGNVAGGMAAGGAAAGRAAGTLPRIVSGEGLSWGTAALTALGVTAVMDKQTRGEVEGIVGDSIHGIQRMSQMGRGWFQAMSGFFGYWRAQQERLIQFGPLHLLSGDELKSRTQQADKTYAEGIANEKAAFYDNQSFLDHPETAAKGRENSPAARREWMQSYAEKQTADTMLDLAKAAAAKSQHDYQVGAPGSSQYDVQTKTRELEVAQARAEEKDARFQTLDDALKLTAAQKQQLTTQSELVVQMEKLRDSSEKYAQNIYQAAKVLGMENLSANSKGQLINNDNGIGSANSLLGLGSNFANLMMMGGAMRLEGTAAKNEAITAEAIAQKEEQARTAFQQYNSVQAQVVALSNALNTIKTSATGEVFTEMVNGQEKTQESLEKIQGVNRETASNTKDTAGSTGETAKGVNTLNTNMQEVLKKLLEKGTSSADQEGSDILRRKGSKFGLTSKQLDELKTSGNLVNYLTLKPQMDQFADAHKIPRGEIDQQLYRESHFNQNQRSGKDALGIFQFTKDTGKRYGLADDRARRDISLGWSAFTGYMSDLLKKYGDRNYLFAMRAYNAGEGHVASDGKGGFKLRGMGAKARKENNDYANFIATQQPNAHGDLADVAQYLASRGVKIEDFKAAHLPHDVFEAFRVSGSLKTHDLANAEAGSAATGGITKDVIDAFDKNLKEGQRQQAVAVQKLQAAYQQRQAEFATARKAGSTDPNFSATAEQAMKRNYTQRIDTAEQKAALYDVTQLNAKMRRFGGMMDYKSQVDTGRQIEAALDKLSQLKAAGKLHLTQQATQEVESLRTYQMQSNQREVEFLNANHQGVMAQLKEAQNKFEQDVRAIPENTPADQVKAEIAKAKEILLARSKDIYQTAERFGLKLSNDALLASTNNLSATLSNIDIAERAATIDAKRQAGPGKGAQDKAIAAVHQKFTAQRDIAKADYYDKVLVEPIKAAADQLKADKSKLDADRAANAAHGGFDPAELARRQEAQENHSKYLLQQQIDYQAYAVDYAKEHGLTKQLPGYQSNLAASQAQMSEMNRRRSESEVSGRQTVQSVQGDLARAAGNELPSRVAAINKEFDDTKKKIGNLNGVLGHVVQMLGGPSSTGTHQKLFTPQDMASLAVANDVIRQMNLSEAEHQAASRQAEAKANAASSINDFRLAQVSQPGMAGSFQDLVNQGQHAQNAMGILNGRIQEQESNLKSLKTEQARWGAEVGTNTELYKGLTEKVNEATSALNKLYTEQARHRSETDPMANKLGGDLMGPSTTFLDQLESRRYIRSSTILRQWGEQMALNLQHEVNQNLMQSLFHNVLGFGNGKDASGNPNGQSTGFGGWLSSIFQRLMGVTGKVGDVAAGASQGTTIATAANTSMLAAAPGIGSAIGSSAAMVMQMGSLGNGVGSLSGMASTLMSSGWAGSSGAADAMASGLAMEAHGGLIGRLRHLAMGGPSGPVSGPGGPTDDRIPAMLSNGEYVVNARSTARFLPLLHAINNGSVMRHFAVGGPALKHMAKSGSIAKASKAMVAGNQNNVGVTVNMSGGGNPQVGVNGNSQQGQQLGRAIQGAIVDEIVRQQRPGGVLYSTGR